MNAVSLCSPTLLENVWFYLQFELQLSAVARLLTGDGDLPPQLQSHGAVEDTWGRRRKRPISTES